MTCSVCGDGLNGTYFTFLNKLICERDYNVSLPELANIDARPVEENFSNIYSRSDPALSCSSEYDQRMKRKQPKNCEYLTVLVVLSVKYPHHSEQLINELFQAHLMAAKVIARDHFL